MAHSDALTHYRAGLYGPALSVLESTRARRELTLDESVSYAELLSLTGAVQAAINSANQLKAERKLTPYHKSRLADVIGLSLFRLGAITAAASEYRKGIELAERSNEQYEECRLRIHLFRNEVRWCGPQKVLADLSQLRRQTNSVATADLAAKFHLGLADLASKLALLPRARKHLETARALLPKVEDQAVHADVLLGEVVLTALESDIVGALQHVTQLVPLAETTGSESLKFGAVMNMAHLLVCQKRFDDALNFIEGALKDRRYGGGSAIALRDTLSLLYLCQGSYDKARIELDVIAELLKRSDSSDSWLGLAHLIHRVKWHYFVGDAAGGLAVALDAIPRIERISGKSVLAKMRLLAAEGLVRTGRTHEATALAAATLGGDPDPSLGLVAEYHRIAGLLCAGDDPRSAADHLDQAQRILDGVGNLAAKSEVEQLALETIPQLWNSEADHRSAITHADTATLSRRISLLGELGAHPRLLAREVCSLLEDTHSTRTVAVVELDPEPSDKVTPAQPSTQESNVVRIGLGRYRGQDWCIDITPKTTPAARTTLLAVEQLVANAVKVARARQQDRERAVLWPESTTEDELGLVCGSERMLDLVNTIRRYGATGLTILVCGETGVGKELFARALHLASPRKDKTFLPFNCASVPKDMLDSQLFGHRKGAFTGAHEAGIGVIRAADGGTLFLDEIGEMSMEAQPKLLRFLEAGEIHPLGEPRPIHVDVRIVAATNANLDQLVSDGKFREDLFYRLNVLPIQIPPLRERREEVPALVEHFVDKFGREMQKPMMRVADETLEYLLLYRWPGNVRQLANEIRRMVALAEPGSMLTPAHLSKEITSTRRTVAVEPSELVMRLDQPLAEATDQLERAAIERALTASNGNNDQAAKILGLSRKGLYLKRQRLGLK